MPRITRWIVNRVMGSTLFTLRLIVLVVTTVLSSVTLHPRAGLARADSQGAEG
jgi:hypothetical protein